MFKPSSLLGAALLSCGLTLAAPAAQAADYPAAKPVRILSPFSAGGINDYLSRLSAKILSESLGGTFVVEQKLGAGGMIASDAVAKSEPDGYVMLMGSISTHGVGPFFYKNLPFDYRKDFTPITVVASAPLVLAVSPKLPAKDVKALVQLLKDKPGVYTFGSAGNGTMPHLAGELFAHVTGTKMVHVPYRGDASAVNDLLGGQIDMMFANLPSVIAHVKAGKLNALAVTTAKRSRSLPETPSMAEAGVAGYEVDGWFGLLGPGGMNPAIPAQIAAALAKGLNTPAAAEQLLGQGAEAVVNTPEQFAQFLKAEQEKWSAVIKQANVTPQ
jgi:tripartite-type tricarboxylate transporter receptor subunit TctC